MRFDHIFIFTFSAALLAGCFASEEADQTTGGQPPQVSKEQKRLAGIETGQLEYRLISSVISCTGEIEVPPQGMASVTAPLGGYIVDTDMVPGRFVKKGTLLATLSNPEYIVLQQSYLETSGQLKFAEQDFTRQKMLEEQNATAVKKRQESESSFTVLKARLAGLKEQLRMIGISFADLEKGNIQSVIGLRAPMTGYVTEVNHHPGQFVEPREVIFEIVNLHELHLHLNAFEKDVAGIRKGQSIRFRPAGTVDDPFWGEVSLVSPQRNTDLRTFDVHGHIDKENERLKPGMYVEAEILLSGDSVYALPQQAIVFHNNESFVLTEQGDKYQVQVVDVGPAMDGWVQIKNADALRGKKVVTAGASRLFAALNRESPQ